MGAFTNPKRFYFVDKDRLGIVEEVTSSSNANASGGFITIDGASTSYETIESAKSLRISGIAKADHFPTGTSATSGDYTNTTAGPLDQIPSQYHEALVFKAISSGYELPTNANLEMAQYFEAKYQVSTKEAKKFSRSNYTRTGVVAPQDF